MSFNCKKCGKILHKEDITTHYVGNSGEYECPYCGVSSIISKCGKCNKYYHDNNNSNYCEVCLASFKNNK